MTIIWLVETVDENDNSVYRTLANDFAVRRIASVESLRSIYKMEDPSRRPQLIICRQPKCEDRLKVLACAHTLKRLMEHCTIALSADSSPTWQEITANQGIPRIVLNLNDGFSLKSQINLLFMLRAGELMLDKIEADATKDTILIGDVEFTPRKSMIQIHGASKENLLPKEARIFEVLAKTPNSCVSRTTLADLVWPGVTVSDRTLDSHVSRLRRKLEPSFECFIDSIYGEGYKLRVGAAESRD